MKKIIVFFLLITVLTIIPGLKTNANEEKLIESKKVYFDYFDTVIVIKIYEPNKVTDSQWNDIETIIHHIQKTFQRTEPEDGETASELYLLNQTAGSGNAFHCSDDLYEVIKVGMDYAKLTQGKLDPAIGPLVDIWDIRNNQIRVRAKIDPIVPTDEEVQAKIPLSDYTKIVLDDEQKTVLLPDKGMVIDLGAIAKGFAADKIVEYMKEQGFTHALINLGGNLFGYGARYEMNGIGTYDWSAQIRDPKGREEDYVGTIYFSNKTVVTSGIYERNFTDPNTGKFYHHILDPHTGYPVDNNLAAVTIIADSSTQADALSTSIFSLGLEDGLNFIENLENTDALFITKDNKIYKTSGFDELYHYEPYKAPKEETSGDLVTTILIGCGIVGVVGLVGLVIYDIKHKKFTSK